MPKVVKENINKNMFYVGTHSGIFHCDEILAVAMIAILAGDVNVIRSRNIELLREETDVLVDIGAGHFDHHQKGGNGIRENGAKYASAGLIWKAFCGRIVKTVIEGSNIERDFTLDEILEIANGVDKFIIQEIDKEDNGQTPYIHPFQFVYSFLPNWNNDKESFDQKFEECVEVVIKILKQAILKVVEMYLYPVEFFSKSFYGTHDEKDEIFDCSNILALTMQTIIKNEYPEKGKDMYKYTNARSAWKAYGKDLIKCFYKEPLTEIEVNNIMNYIDQNIIQSNSSESLFKFISLYFPNHNEQMDYDRKLNECVEVTREVMKNVIVKSVSICLSPKETELRLANPRTHIDNILVIPAQTFPWENNAIEHNEKSPNSPIDFVVFPYPDGGYALQCVPPSKEEMKKQRISLPEEWAGETSNLPEISGIPSATFCHNNKFFARANNYGDIIEMCKIATNKYGEKKSTI